MPRAPKTDPKTVQILNHTESGTGIYFTDFATLCNDRQDIYGAPGTELRRAYQRKRSRLLSLKVCSLKKVFYLAGIKPNKHTLKRMKELEQEEKETKEAAKKKESKEEEEVESDDIVSDESDDDNNETDSKEGSEQQKAKSK